MWLGLLQLTGHRAPSPGRQTLLEQPHAATTWVNAVGFELQSLQSRPARHEAKPTCRTSNTILRGSSISTNNYTKWINYTYRITTVYEMFTSD